nr:SEC14-like protein 5 [Ipomoea batatas]
MEDSVSNPSSRRNSGTNCAMISSNPSKRHAIASGSKSFAHQSLKRISLLDCGKVGRGAGGQIALFLLKVAALESVRRISKSKCPPVWSGLQALQVVCYPPFKWIQRWNPFGMLVKGMQMLSRPLLVLSIATAFSDNPECSDSTTESNEVNQGHIDPHDVSEFEPELSSTQSTTTLRVEDDPQQSVLPANWLPRLYKELENQGITLTDRLI